MEKNTNEYNEIEKIFTEKVRKLGYKCKKIEIDNDLNFQISFKTNNKIGNIKEMEALMYLQKKDYSLYMLVADLYKFEDEEDKTPFYRIVNEVNAVFNDGKFVINENEGINQIIYADSVYCGEEFVELSENKIKLLIERFLDNLLIFINKLFKMEKGNE